MVTTPSERARTAAILAALVVLTLAAYAPVFSAGWVWDDDAWLTENPAIAGEGGLRAIWTSVPRMQYYPLLFTSFWVEHKLWGFHPLGYHVVNVLLHAANAFLFGLVLRTLGVRGAWWAAALFAVHPLHVESVAWVTERKNVLSGLFYLGSALAFLRFDAGRRRSLYALALALFACAMLTKTATAVLPVALAIALAWRAWPLTTRDAAPLAPFVLVAVGLASITVVLEKGMVDVVGWEFGFSWWERVSIAARALVFYPWKLAVPYPLIFNYPRWDPSQTALWAFLAATLAAAGLAVLWHRGRRGLPCAALVYAVGIFPALGFFDVYAFRFSFVADHFAYLASLGVLVVFPQAGRFLPSRAARAAGVALVLALALLTFRQAGAYRDEATLWKDTLAKNPDSWIAHHNLATIESEAGNLDGAIAEFGEALRCKPQAAESYTGRGFAYTKKGLLDLALADLDRAVELDPSFPQAYLNRAEALVASQRFAEAILDFDRFVAANPAHAPAYLSRAMAYVQLGRDPEALDDLTRAIAIAPGSAELFARRGFVLNRMRRYDDALVDLDAAIRLDPRLAVAYVLRGGLYRRADGATARACAEWEQACRLGDCRIYDAECRGR